MNSYIPQRPIRSSLDLRDMLRQHLITRSLKYMEESSIRRKNAVGAGEIDEYCKLIKKLVRNFYGELPIGKAGVPVNAKVVSCFEKNGYRIENVLFESFPGWEVNASVYVPLNYQPPFPAVIMPVGHSGKQFESYQLPCQFFARSGYVAVVFDPPGQSSEKQPGNDHFRDGVRCYLTGETSSQYFITDALRCIDYLETRKDVELSHGVAMTGVSGGGTTTYFSSLLDDRIAVIGPSCCVTSLKDLDISQCYAGCPETHMWGRYADGIDIIDLLCAGTPKPTLLMAGKQDNVFRISDTQALADIVSEFFTTAKAEKNFQFFIDDNKHCYSLIQAEKFTQFMNLHLLNEPQRRICELKDENFEMNPYEELQCHPRTDINMLSLSLKRAEELADTRSGNVNRIDNAIAASSGISIPVKTSIPKVEEGDSFKIWTHYWHSILLKPEHDIELPASYLYSGGNTPASTVLHFDDKHRNRYLHRHGLLGKAIGFLDQSGSELSNILSVDLRGFGDTAVAMYPYEMASWGSTDRYLAYTSAALGDSLTGMRVRDGLASLAYLRSRPETDPDNIVITGCGTAGIVALHVAALDKNIKGVVVWDTLYSFQSLLETENFTWPHDICIPNVLLNYDLPELIASVECDVAVLNPLDSLKNPIDDKLIESCNTKLHKEIYTRDSDDSSIAGNVMALLKACRI